VRIPSSNEGGSLARFDVQSNGQPVPRTAMLEALQVRHRIDDSATARLVFADGDMAAGGWTLTDSPLFEPGSPLRIDAGYGGELAPVFEGVVASLSARSGSDSGSTLVVECRRQAADPPPVVDLAALAAAAPVLQVAFGVDLIEFEATTTAHGPRGHVKFQGSSQARVATIIELQNVGARFSGVVLVEDVAHAFAAGSWLTTVTFVSADPQLGQRVAAPDAAKAPVAPGERHVAIDETGGVLTVSTPAGNRVVLSDADGSVRLEDQNGNSVELGRDGVAITTPKGLTIASQGPVSMAAVGAIRIASKGDVHCGGMNVACEAQAGFSAKGAASAELVASGQTTVQGAIVLIN
jgi:hypothetical protein